MLRKTGIVRNLATNNRCTIPIEITNGWEIKPGDPLEYCVYDKDGLSGVLIFPYKCKCVFCGSSDDLLDYKNEKVCHSCKNDIVKHTV